MSSSNIVCNVCNKSFSSKQMLQYHIKQAVCQKANLNSDLLSIFSSKVEQHQSIMDAVKEMFTTLQKQISDLSGRVAFLENENSELKEKMKKKNEEKHDNKYEKTEEERKKESMNRLFTYYVKLDKETNKRIFMDENIPHAIGYMNGKDNPPTICAVIQPDGLFRRLNEKDRKSLESLFRSIGASFPLLSDDKYDWFIEKAGINLRGDKFKPEEDEDDKEDKDEEDEDQYDEKEESVIVPPLPPKPKKEFFFKSEKDGKMYFLNTRATAGLLSEFKEVYRNDCKRDANKIKQIIEDTAGSAVRSAMQSCPEDMIEYFDQE